MAHRSNGRRQTGGTVRVVFFGSPQFAVPILEALESDPEFEVAMVVTQAARGVSPVERSAGDLGLPVYKPATLRDAVSRAPLIAAEADVFVVAAFGLIFRQRTLGIPRLGCVNVHPSLLPMFRGAVPIPAAIAAGNRETGVSLMAMDEGIDTGNVISVEHASIAEDDTSESLGRRLAQIGARQLVRDLPRWAEGTLMARPQTDQGATLTRPLTKADGWLDWSRPALELARHVRAMWPWPRAWTTVDDATLQVHAAAVLHGEYGAEPGHVIPDSKRLLIGTGEGVLELLTVEPANRRAMSATAYLNGRRTPLVVVGREGAPAPQPPIVVAVPPPIA
jgi:methionyl-tRNA formyltransferase